MGENLPIYVMNPPGFTRHGCPSFAVYLFRKWGLAPVGTAPLRGVIGPVCWGHPRDVSPWESRMLGFFNIPAGASVRPWAIPAHALSSYYPEQSSTSRIMDSGWFVRVIVHWQICFIHNDISPFLFVIPGLTRNPVPSWIPAPRFRGDKLRGNDRVCSD